MSWNFRLMRYPESTGGGFGIHAVFYSRKPNDDDHISYTEQPTIALKGETVEELKESFEDTINKMRTAFDKAILPYK